MLETFSTNFIYVFAYILNVTSVKLYIEDWYKSTSLKCSSIILF